jgi:hypothetical protein
MRSHLLKNYHLLWRAHLALLQTSSLLGKNVVPARVACLGKDVFQNSTLINKQKLRLDIFLEQLTSDRAPIYKKISPYILRQDILPLIVQQCIRPWSIRLLRKSQFFVIDSYSELTDQEFRHRQDGWSFCANYSDINHDGDFDAHFESLGLLPNERILEIYAKFFKWLRSINPKITIVFIHFPTNLDSREKFRERGEVIHHSIESLQLENIYNLKVSESVVRPNASDNFPYHFSNFTKNEFVDLLNQIPNLMK